MRADSLPLDPARVTVLKVQAPRAVPINAEFVAMVSSRDMRMAPGLDIRIDADGRRCAHSQPRRLLEEQFDFGLRFHVEQQNAGKQGATNIISRLAHAGKDDAISRHADAPQTVEFPSGNDIETASE